MPEPEPFVPPFTGDPTTVAEKHIAAALATNHAGELQDGAAPLIARAWAGEMESLSPKVIAELVGSRLKSDAYSFFMKPPAPPEPTAADPGAPANPAADSHEAWLANWRQRQADVQSGAAVFASGRHSSPTPPPAAPTAEADANHEQWLKSYREGQAARAAAVPPGWAGGGK